MSTIHDTEWAVAVDDRLTALENRLRENTEVTIANAEVTTEVRDILNAAKGAFKFFGWLAQFVSWSLKLGGALATAYVTVKSIFPHYFPK